MRRSVSILAFFLLLCCTDRGPSPRADAILLVTIDTCRADRIGCYGNDAGYTPTLDRLAREGAQFLDCTVQVPTTLASHVTILASLHPRNHGVPRNGFLLPADVRTVAQIFREEGFRTAAFVAAFPLDHSFGLDRGFERYDDETETRPEGGELERDAGAVTVRAADWLREVGEEPFFLWVHYFDPHWPYAPPDPYARLSRQPVGPYDPADMDDLHAARAAAPPFGAEELRPFTSAYDGEIAFVDRNLRLLLEAVPPARRERLLTVVTSDHGEGLGEHRYYFDHGEFLWESAIRVPLLIHSPLLLPESLVVGSPVRALDIAPTLLEAGGLSVPGAMEGRSLLAAGEGRLPPSLSFSEASKPWGVETPGEYQNRHKAKAIRTDRWKLVVTPFLDREQLFDLVSDPGEDRNVSLLERERADSLAEVLTAWLAETDPGFEEGDLTAKSELREKLKALGYSR